ncbi:MAG: 3-deoxy-D-manno-octulosonic acid transferase, partial [Flavobacteriaceae bacterium]
MIFIYTFLTHIAGFILKGIALCHPKIKLFIEGRTQVFQLLEQHISKQDHTIWVHCASLGEFEQGLPVIERLKDAYLKHKIVLTFFSPSGYEVKKHSGVADVITYLPLDTTANAKKFIRLVHPEMVFFVKYEFWPNYLAELQQQHIQTYLISGIFRPNQSFFKWYGKWMRKSLKTFDHFFVQNENSKQLLHSIKFTNVTVNGDTRFDRVLEILSRDNSLNYIEQFKNDTLTIVYGSSWPEDEVIYVNAINHSDQVKHIIAPHNINKLQLEKLRNSITKPVVLYSDMTGKNLADYDVFIIDTVGLLTKIYSYADIAYVGGAFKSGLHNTLEPAVFGVPIITGPLFEKFQEAKDLVHLKGILVVHSKSEYQTTIENLMNSK